MTERPTGLLAIRPEPGLSATVTLGHDLGFSIVGYPLFEVRARQWRCPDPGGVDALLIGSANAIRHGGDALGRLRGKPVHAVGEATARAAREAGFAVAGVGGGGLQKVLDSIAAPARLLRIAGAEHVPLYVPEGITIQMVIGYETVPLPLDPAILQEAGERPLVLLHSASAASHFAGECDRVGIARARLALAALGPRIASAAGGGWRAIHVAPRPSDREMLESLQEACI